MAKFPATLGENDYRIVLSSCIRGDYPWEQNIVFREGQYQLTMTLYSGKSIEMVFKSLLSNLAKSYGCHILTSVEFTMTSPTDEEREVIMRVWNEWQDEQKESNNEQ